MPSWHRRDVASVTEGLSLTNWQKLLKVDNERDLRKKKMMLSDTALENHRTTKVREPELYQTGTA